MSQNTDAVRAVHEAFQRGDIPGLLETLADDVEWVVPESLPWGGSFRGREGVGEFFAQLPEYFDELIVNVDELLDAGDAVVDVGHFSGTAKGGRELDDIPYVFIWRMKDGTASSFREYGDTAMYRDAVMGQVTA